MQVALECSSEHPRLIEDIVKNIGGHSAPYQYKMGAAILAQRGGQRVSAHRVLHHSHYTRERQHAPAHTYEPGQRLSVVSLLSLACQRSERLLIGCRETPLFGDNRANQVRLVR